MHVLQGTRKGYPHRRGLKPLRSLLVENIGVAPRHAVRSPDALACVCDCVHSVARPAGIGASADATKLRATSSAPARNKSGPASNCSEPIPALPPPLDSAPAHSRRAARLPRDQGHPSRLRASSQLLPLGATTRSGITAPHN